MELKEKLERTESRIDSLVEQSSIQSKKILADTITLEKKEQLLLTSIDLSNCPLLSRFVSMFGAKPVASTQFKSNLSNITEVILYNESEVNSDG